MKHLLFLIAPALLIVACKKDDGGGVLQELEIDCQSEPVPNCILESIMVFRDSAECPADARVLRYEFQGDCVFLFDEGGCINDFPNRVKNETCEIIGSVGGFSPDGDTINGESFSSAKFADTMWAAQNNDHYVKTRQATIRWTGAYEVDGCGFFVDIDNNSYKPNDEESIPEAFQSVSDSTVSLVYTLPNEQVVYACGFNGEQENPAIHILAIE